MPTNANTFNSRVTSESLEAKFRQVFPAQGGAELVQDLFASGVIQPVVDFSSVAEGSVLAPNLQTAWDFSTGSAVTRNTTASLITNTGFWVVNATVSRELSADTSARLEIYDGSSARVIWNAFEDFTFNNADGSVTFNGVVFLRSGDSLRAVVNNTSQMCNSWRQIADVNGNLVNPLGFVFS